VTFGDDKKGKMLGTGVIKVNDYFTLNNVALVDRLRYNLLFISQLCDTHLSVLFHGGGFGDSVPGRQRRSGVPRRPGSSSRAPGTKNR
jgi:hypothetical protein